MLGFQGTLALDFLHLPRVEIESEGFVSATVDGARLLSLVPNGQLGGAVNVPIPVPLTPAAPTVAVSFDAQMNGGVLGPFWPRAAPGAPQLTANRAPAQGFLRLCVILPDCSLPVVLVLAQSSGALGVGGTLTVGGLGSIRASLDAAPWTVDTVSITVRAPGGTTHTSFANGWIHGAVSFTQSTAAIGGELSVVTPLQFTAGDLPQLTAIGRATLRFVPEPGAAGMLLAGAALLASLQALRGGARSR